MGTVEAHPSSAGGPNVRPPELISDAHDLAEFACGHDELNEWLQKRALKSDARSARTYVICVGNRVIGYYCLAAGATTREHLATAKLRQNLPPQVPVIVIGRLAIDDAFRGQGLGGDLLRDALKRALAAAQAIGVRGVLVHAIDDNAVGFYKKYGFLESPINPRTLILPVETVAAAL